MAGVLYVVGIGPGEEAQMTPQADEAVRQSQVLAGYTVYVDLLRERYYRHAPGGKAVPPGL